MKTWSISKKLWCYSLFTLFLIGGMSGVSYFFTRELSESLTELGEKQIPAVRAMTLADMMHDSMRASVYGSVVYATEPEKLKEINGEFGESSKNFFSYIAKIKDLNKSDTELLQLIDQTEAKVDLYSKAGHKIIDLVMTGKRDDAVRELSSFGTAFDELAQEMESLGDRVEKKSQDKVTAGADLSRRADFTGLVIVVCGAILSLLISFFLNRQLVSSLRTIITGLSNESQIVTKTSHVIADVSGKLSEATTEQAASLQETVASIDEISAMVARNADSASSSAKTSEVTTLSAQKGKDKVEQMLQSITAISVGNDDIIQQMQRSNREISDIVKVIEDISEKTKVINDIVFQTKLLSFNASVEAARAGEHGKGFAVVAEEVGNLASMSGKAADEISSMLTSSVKKVTSIVEGTKDLMENLIRQSKEKIDFGTSTARDCAQALDEILSNVSSVNEMVREISNASHEQSSGVREVNKAMSELDQVTQSNSAIAQESSQTAYDLKEQADRLGELIHDLTKLVNGTGQAEVASHKATHESATNAQVVPLHPRSPVKVKDSGKKLKRIVGIESVAPKSDDPRFEDA